MKRTLTLIQLLLFAGLLHAQTDTSYRLLDFMYRPTNDRTTAYPVVTLSTRTEDGNYRVEDFNLRTGKILQRYYVAGSDTSMRIGPNQSYQANGSPWKKGHYKNGRKIGPWTSTNQKGEISDSCFFNDDGNIVGVTRSYFEGGGLMDSAFYHPDSSGRGHARQFHGDGSLRGEGRMINEDFDGEWKFYYPSGKPSAIEYYENGKLKHMQCFEEDGSISKGDCVAEKDAEFPAGLDSWQRYIISAVEKRVRQMAADEATGTAWVSFIVDKDGKIIEPTIYISSGTALDKYALDIIRNAPKWKPAKQHNMFVKAYRRQPITFKLQ